MTPLALAFRIETHRQVVSTQQLLFERLVAGDAVHGLVVRAGSQTGAYGRRGDAWRAEPGGSYQSLGVRDGDPPRLERGAAPLAVAIGVAEALREYGAQVTLKWPNDLHYRGKKLGGVLGEYRRGHLLVGVGVNVDNAVPAGAVGLRGWDLEAVHATVLRGVQAGLELAWSGGPLAARFAPLDALAGCWVEVSSGGRMVAGRARGIGAAGGLVLAAGDNEITVAAGHVEQVECAAAS